MNAVAAQALRAPAHLAAPARGSPGARGLRERARPGLWLAGRPRPGPRPRRPRAPQWGRLRAILRFTVRRWNRATALSPLSLKLCRVSAWEGRGVARPWATCKVGRQPLAPRGVSTQAGEVVLSSHAEKKIR